MSKNKILLIFGAFILIGLSIVYFFNEFNQKIEITNETIQKSIDSKMPFSKEMPFGEVSIKEAKVDLNNSIKIHSYGVLEGAGREVPFVVEAEGNLKYNSGSFYFVPTNVNVKLKEMEVIEETSIKSKIFGKLSEVSKKVGINKQNVEEKIAEVVKDKMGNIPIYKVKQTLVVASLKDVVIQENKVVLELSLLELTKSLIIGIVVIFLGVLFVIAVVRSGGGFLGELL